MEVIIKLFFILIFNAIVVFGNASYAHDNLEQHAIVHVYPLLESKYLNDENAKCKMGVLKIYNCNIIASEKKKIIK